MTRELSTRVRHGLPAHHAVERPFVWSRDLAAGLVFVTVAMAPLPLGSVSPVAVASFSVLAGLALFGFVIWAPSLPSPGIVAAGIAALVAAYAIVAVLQMIPRMPGDVLAHPIWGEAGRLIEPAPQASTSIARDQPLLAVGPPLLTMMMFICGYFCGADDHLARRLMQVVAWAGLGYAVLGILWFAVDPTMVLWREKLAYKSSLTGTFANRNAAAVYFGSCAVLWLLLFFQKLDQPGESRRSRRRRRRRRSFREKFRHAIVPFICFLLCLMAALLTGSRAGVGCTFLGLFVAYVLSFTNTISRRTRRWLMLGGALFVALIIYQIAGSSVGERLQAEGTSGGGRMAALQSCWTMIAQFPWLGTGLGTFVWSFAAYRSPDISGWGVWDKAHNILVEIAVEGGVPLAGVVLLSWLAAVAILARAAIRTSRPAIEVLAAVSVCVIALLHSLVDFSMQIPAYSVTVTVLVGLGIAKALKGAEAQPPPVNPDPIG
ncbi:O-antigen ligase family protein [Afipia sp. TerB]